MLTSEKKPSKKPADVAEKLTERMLVYSSFRPEQYAEYSAAFKRMIAEFGEMRTTKGLTDAIDATPDFPPTPGTIRQYIPREGSRRATCKLCQDTEGFIWTTVRHSRTGQTERGVKLCTHEEP